MCFFLFVSPPRQEAFAVARDGDWEGVTFGTIWEQFGDHFGSILGPLCNNTFFSKNILEMAHTNFVSSSRKTVYQLNYK